MKLNFRFVRTSQYISQFNFDLRYRFDKIPLISDVLNRFFELIEILIKILMFMQILLRS